jgi:hypothetical protein
LPDLPDLQDQQDQQEGPDQQLLPVKALFLSLELWGDSQAGEIKHFKKQAKLQKQNIQHKTLNNECRKNTNILRVG